MPGRSACTSRFQPRRWEGLLRLGRNETNQMQDFIGNTRAQQRSTARELIQRHKLDKAIDAQLLEAIEVARGANRELDPQLAREILASELERDIYTALVGYSDWLASRLWRAYGVQPQVTPLPQSERLRTCDEVAQARIMQDYCVDAEPLNLVLTGVEGGLTLPPIGHVDDRRVLHINWESVARWADLYDWRSSDG